MSDPDHVDAFRVMAREDIPRLERGQQDELLRLTEHAVFALRSGLRLPPYLELDWLTRRAFIAAGDTLRALDAQRKGLANMGVLGAGFASADVDGGEAAAAAFQAQQHALAVASIEAETEISLRGS